MLLHFHKSLNSGRQKRHFARMTEKITDDDNDRWHDNYDRNFGNFDDHNDKNYFKKLTNIVKFKQKITFSGTKKFG